MNEQLTNTACGERCEGVCDLMTENRENCLSFCNLDDLCEEENGISDAEHQTGSQSGSSNESGESSEDNSESESSTWSGFDYVADDDYDEDDDSFESEIIESDETVGYQPDLNEEEHPDNQATGSIQTVTASDFNELTGSEWEASIQYLPSYEQNCTDGRCHDGVMNLTEPDSWAIQHGHHPHDYTIDKKCWIRWIFKFWLTLSS